MNLDQGRLGLVQLCSRPCQIEVFYVVDGARRLWSLKLVPEADLGKSSVLFRLRQNHDRLGSVKLLGRFLSFLGRR